MVNELVQAAPLLAVLLLTLLLVGMGVRLRRLRAEMQRQSKRMGAMQDDLRALCNAAVQMGERVNLMDARMKAVHQRQQELGVRQEKMSQSEPFDFSYDQAIKMARSGRSVEEIMVSCNLSRGEADLIAMMHRLEPTP